MSASVSHAAYPISAYMHRHMTTCRAVCAQASRDHFLNRYPTFLDDRGFIVQQTIAVIRSGAHEARWTNHLMRHVEQARDGSHCPESGIVCNWLYHELEKPNALPLRRR
jgi:hypothetical protein